MKRAFRNNEARLPLSNQLEAHPLSKRTGIHIARREKRISANWALKCFENISQFKKSARLMTSHDFWLVPWIPIASSISGRYSPEPWDNLSINRYRKFRRDHQEFRGYGSQGEKEEEKTEKERRLPRYWKQKETIKYTGKKKKATERDSVVRYIILFCMFLKNESLYGEPK